MSFHNASVYNKSTGEIVQTGAFSCDENYVELNFAARVDAYGGSSTHGVLDLWTDPAVHYIVFIQGEPVVAQRPDLRVSINKTTIIADGTDSVILSGLPSPCEVIQDPGEPEEQKITVTGGGFVFTAENPGVYQFRIDRFPFLTLDLEFTAT